MNDVTVVVATFGDEDVWLPFAKRAVNSAVTQTRPPEATIYFHGEGLAQARNAALDSVRTKYVIFLDADDTLDGQYVEAMMAVNGDIRRPATLGVYEDGSEDALPVMIPRKPIRQSNFIVIGAMMPSDLVREAGGFDPSLPALEDWDLFQSLILHHGADVVDVPNAIYRVGVHPNSRNSNSHIHAKAYSMIRGRYV